MARLRGRRQTKETATDKPNLLVPAHNPTLRSADFAVEHLSRAAIISLW